MYSPWAIACYWGYCLQAGDANSAGNGHTDYSPITILKSSVDYIGYYWFGDDVTGSYWAYDSIYMDQ